MARPIDFGLPYDEWWTGQLDAITNVTKLFKDTDSKVVMLLADTGTGKSGIAKAVSNEFSTSTVLTRTISLEEQYGELTGLEIGRGRRWHKCYNGYSDAAKCMEADRCEGPCEYRLHIDRLGEQRFRILNYAQFFALNITRPRFRSELIICDEAHGLENSLQSFVDLWYGKGTPTWGSEYKHLLFNNGNRFLLMSASMIPALVAETMGIEEDEYEVYEAENDFDPDLNPVFVRPVGYITSQRPLTDRICKWIDNHLDGTVLNGVVHTSSDKQTEEILQGVAARHRGRFLWPKGTSRNLTFKTFKEAGPNAGAVLISASASEGVDLPDDECRWQVITKVPYANLGSPHVRARREERPEIYRLEALQRIQQDCGRGCRSPDDWCTNYILDATVIGLYEKQGHLLSRKFHQSWRGVV